MWAMRFWNKYREMSEADLQWTSSVMEVVLDCMQISKNKRASSIMIAEVSSIVLQWDFSQRMRCNKKI